MSSINKQSKLYIIGNWLSDFAIKSLHITCHKQLLYLNTKESGSSSCKIGINKGVSVCSSINKYVGLNS